jgi:hypothetical protein
MPLAQRRDSATRLLAQHGLRLAEGTAQGSNYARQYSTWEALGTPDTSLLARFLPLLCQEWQVYPQQLARCLGLRGIELVRNLKVQGTPRAAMPDAEAMILYLDIGYLAGNEPYVRKVIHHEYYHLVEQALFGTMFARERSWTRLNPPDFTYRASSGADAYTDPTYRSELHPQPGFVSTYSTYSPEEDRAEVFAFLFAHHLRTRHLQQWLPQDATLRQKVTWLQTRLRDHCPQVWPDGYWAELGL